MTQCCYRNSNRRVLENIWTGLIHPCTMTICHLPPRTLIGEVDKIDVGIKTPHLWGRTPGINALPIMLVSVLPPFSLRFLFVAVSTFGRLMGWIRAVRRLLIYFVTQPPHSPDSYRIVVDKAKWATFTPVWVKTFFCFWV